MKARVNIRLLVKHKNRVANERGFSLAQAGRFFRNQWKQGYKDNNYKDWKKFGHNKNLKAKTARERRLSKIVADE
ncbi:hypothetical protein GCM10023229_22950 [Flavisolibacter ginsenosidimutans]